MNTITPAMRKWCARLVNPEACTIYRRMWWIQCDGYSSHAAPNEPFATRMEKAGLIRFEPFGDGRTIGVLTDAGRAAAGVTP